MLNLLLSSSIPFFPQNFGVDLIATWSDGNDSTAAVDVEVKSGWVYLIGTKDPSLPVGTFLWVLKMEPSKIALVNEVLTLPPLSGHLFGNSPSSIS